MSEFDFVAIGIVLTATGTLFIVAIREIVRCHYRSTRWLRRAEAELDAWEEALSPEERAAYRAELARIERTVTRRVTR